MPEAFRVRMRWEACGGSLATYIKKKDSAITDSGFLVFGCDAFIASSSVITELSEGKTLESALKTTDAGIADALDGLSEHKVQVPYWGAVAL